jgi:secondary thiamine-phosphate synthase enzyme
MTNPVKMNRGSTSARVRETPSVFTLIPPGYMYAFKESGFMVHQQRIQFTTAGPGDMRDITRDVADIASLSNVITGTINVSVIGSTGAVGTIEFEPGLQRDLPEMLERLIPPGRHYGHEQAWHDGNAHSHLQATMLGPSLTVPVSDGAPVLGTWQQIFFLECDVRQRDRTLVVTVMGE